MATNYTLTAIIREGEFSVKNLKCALVCAILSLVSVATDASESRASEKISFDTYAAIAYSPSTGHYGYAWNHGSRGAAERVALSKCKEPDAKIVGWVKAGWLVLAIGEDNAYGVGWTYGNGATNSDAEKFAVDDLGTHTKGSKRPKVIVCVCSGNIDPEIIK